MFNFRLNTTRVFPPIMHRRSATRFVELVALGLFQAACLIITAVLMRTLFSDNPVQPVMICIGLFALAIAGSGCRWRERFISEHLAVNYVHEVRMQLFDAASEATTQRGVGVQMVRFSSDLTALRQWVSLGCARGISSTLFVIGLLIAIAIIQPGFALVITGILAGGILAGAVIGLQLETAVAATRSRRARLANKVSGALLQMPTILNSGRINKERARIVDASAALNEKQIHRAFWQGCLRAATEFTHRCSLLAVVCLGVLVVPPNQFSLGDALAVFAIVALISGPVRDLGRVFEYWKNNKIARRNLTPLLLGHKPSRTQTAKLAPGSGSVHISAGKICEQLTVHDLVVPAGQRIALLGASGSGKSTFLRTLAGLHPGFKGDARVYLDDTDTRLLSTRDRQRSIGLASSQDELVEGSLSKNLRLRMAGASEAALAQACTAAGLNNFIEALPEGLSTRVGRGRFCLSQTQATQIKLARAILAQPRLLLLDEVEQGLDKAGRKQLSKLLSSYPGTIVYATHDPILLLQADSTWLLSNGALSENPDSASQWDEVG